MRMAKIFIVAPKVVSFSQLPAVKNPPFSVQLEFFFGLSYSVMALLLQDLPKLGLFILILLKVSLSQFRNHISRASLENYVFRAIRGAVNRKQATYIHLRAMAAAVAASTMCMYYRPSVALIFCLSVSLFFLLSLAPFLCSRVKKGTTKTL